LAKTLEPPVLLSRALTFVLATSVVVLVTLVITLFKMIPLERPEVFFVLKDTSTNNVTIKPMTPDSYDYATIENYKRGFIREYIIARNTLETGSNLNITVNNWENVVKPWSTSKVYNEFKKTKLYNKYTFNEQSATKSCSVSFSNKSKEEAIIDMNNGYYQVNFTLLCKNISGQPDQNFYKIKLRIQSELDKDGSKLLGNLDKLRNNPLGIQVSEYTIMNGLDDPLDSE
jgi:type IV secretory pathway component VirB8